MNFLPVRVVASTVAALTFTLLGHVARAQSADAPDWPTTTKSQTTPSKPDASAILRAADAKMRGLTSLSFRARATPVGLLGAALPTVEATVRLQRRENDPLGFAFEVRGRALDAVGERDIASAYDGKMVRSVRARDRRVVDAPPDLAAQAMDDGTGLVVEWLLRWPEFVHHPFADPASPGPARFEGVGRVDGVECDIIYVDYSDTSDPTLFDAWWYIARSDSLPRRIDLHRVDPSRGDGFVMTTLADLELNPPITLAALAAPDAFEKKTIEQPERRPARAAGGAGAGALAPDFVLKDPQGKEHRLSDYRGKVVVLDFWATWCGPCQLAMPGLQKLHEKHPTAVVLGLNCWEDGDPSAFMKDKGYTYGLLLKADEVASKYGVSGIPAFFVIGKDGRILHSAVGFDPDGEEKIGSIIEAQGK